MAISYLHSQSCTWMAYSSPCSKAGAEIGWQKLTDCSGTTPGRVTLPSLQMWILWLNSEYHCKTWTLMHKGQRHKTQTWQNKWHLAQGHGSCKTHFCTWAYRLVPRWNKKTRWHHTLLLVTWYAASLGCYLPWQSCPKLPDIQRSWQSSRKRLRKRTFKNTRSWPINTQEAPGQLRLPWSK